MKINHFNEISLKFPNCKLCTIISIHNYPIKCVKINFQFFRYTHGYTCDWNVEDEYDAGSDVNKWIN